MVTNMTKKPQPYKPSSYQQKNNTIEDIRLNFKSYGIQFQRRLLFGEAENTLFSSTKAGLICIPPHTVLIYKPIDFQKLNCCTTLRISLCFFLCIHLWCSISTSRLSPRWWDTESTASAVQFTCSTIWAKKMCYTDKHDAKLGYNSIKNMGKLLEQNMTNVENYPKEKQIRI